MYKTYTSLYNNIPRVVINEGDSVRFNRDGTITVNPPPNPYENPNTVDIRTLQLFTF